jgi:hypothetical protein
MYKRGNEDNAFKAVALSAITGVEHEVCSNPIDPRMAAAKIDCNQKLLPLEKLRDKDAIDKMCVYMIANNVCTLVSHYIIALFSSCSRLQCDSI